MESWARYAVAVYLGLALAGALGPDADRHGLLGYFTSDAPAETHRPSPPQSRRPAASAWPDHEPDPKHEPKP